MKDTDPRFHAFPKVEEKLREIERVPLSQIDAIAADIKRIADGIDSLVTIWKDEIMRTRR